MTPNVFFEFCSKLSSSTVQAHGQDLKVIDEAGIDEIGMLIKGDYNGIHFPVLFKQQYGSKFTDILGAGWPSLYLISDRMKKILEENKLTGWKSYPIKLYDKKNDEITGYNGFSVTGQCDPIDYSNSDIIEKSRVPGGPLVEFYKGMYIDLGKWDGTDFFSPLRDYGLFTTRKAAEILTNNKITNLRLTDVVDIEINIKTV